MAKALQKRYNQSGKNKKTSIFLKKILEKLGSIFLKKTPKTITSTVIMNNRILSISQVFSLGKLI